MVPAEEVFLLIYMKTRPEAKDIEFEDRFDFLETLGEELKKSFSGKNLQER